MNTYVWQITALDCYPQAEGETDVVFNAHWTVVGSNGTVSASVYSTQALTYVAGTPYTPYADLTQEQVIGWVQTAMGAEQVTAIQINLDTQIENIVNPPVTQPPLPWVQG